MLRVTIRFPLGVYHAQSTESFEEAEWPPSPLRVLGALLAAAHGRQGHDPTADRALLQRLCEAPPPLIVAPESVGLDEPVSGADEVVRLRGATRWAPRNYIQSDLSPRNIGRERASVSKVGVAIGDRPVHMVWPGMDLDPVEVARLGDLAADVSFVGTTRSPALVEVDAAPPSEGEISAWEPISDDSLVSATAVRVPNASTIADFDRRQDARRSDRDGVRSGGMVPGIWIGEQVRYTHSIRFRQSAAIDPCWWGEMIVVAVDGARSEVLPNAPAAYLVARAVRVALLGAYEEPGMVDEAPPILTARGAEPHCAVVPLPFVWGEYANGRILGVAFVLPHERRVPGILEQRARVELGLRRLAVDEADHPRRFVSIPKAGRIWLKVPDARAARAVTLREERYRSAARWWVSVTPIVHSRWRKGGEDALLRQVTADCAHVGLPAPERVEILRGAGHRGGADRMVAPRQVPEQWRSLLNGPADHLKITFAQPVRGPVLLGRARHFGLGLCVPAGEPG